MAATQRNHYLPQFYLKAFIAQNDPKLFWVYDKKHNAFRQQTPINTGIQRHLYNLENPDGTVDDTFEREIFTPIETACKPVLDRLLSYKLELRPNEIGPLAEFLAFMATRIPRSIGVTQEIGGALALRTALDLATKRDQIEKILTILQQEGKIDNNVTADEMQQILERADKDFEFSMNKKAAMMMSLVMTQDVHRQLLEMNWCLCRAPSGSNFICSDSPLVCFILYSDGSAKFGGGYANPTAEITFPISPDRCLHLDRKHTQRYRAVNKNFVKEINKRTAWAAERFIISTTKTKYFQELCTWASQSVESPKIDKDEILKRANRIFS